MIKKKRVFRIGREVIKPGERKIVQLDVAALYDYTSLSIPIEVIRGKKSGPVLFVCAAIHGDEINGVEIIKRMLRSSFLSQINGTLIAVPVVNVFGFNNRSRYLPDRRDLNRSFPGRKDGSLASRLAQTFMKEVVNKCTHGIDLHTGAIHRSNIPQIRANLDEPETKRLAAGFGVPVVIHSGLRDGSLREAARRKNIPMLLFEGEQALRFEENVIQAGYKGIFRTMQRIGMFSKGRFKVPTKGRKPFVAKSSAWIRAPHSGSFQSLKKLGEPIRKGDVLGMISDPFGREVYEVYADQKGVLVGQSEIPLVNQGDAMFHIASL